MRSSEVYQLHCRNFIINIAHKCICGGVFDIFSSSVINDIISFQSGLLQGIMHLLLLSMSAHLTKELGMAPGGEFRRAYHEVHYPMAIPSMTV